MDQADSREQPFRRLDAELKQVRSAPRAEAVQTVKAIRARELAALSQAQIERINELTGVDVARSITAMTDSILRALCARAFDKAGAAADHFERVAVIALGGYGRSELSPSSDIDLLLLCDDKRPAWLTAANAEFQTLLWDVGFQVGGSLRELDELDGILKEDFVTATAVLEHRLITGSQRVMDALDRLVGRFRSKRAREFFHFKLEELSRRRAQTGASVFLMEPNLKSNPGCLRDVQLLRNIAFMLFGSSNLSALEQLDVITGSDIAKVAAANDHLLSIRSLLHFHHGRKHDIFQLADQLRIAKQLGYQDVSKLRAVEHLMKAHYAQVLHVHQMVDLVHSRLYALGHLGRKPILVLSRKVLDPDFTAVHGKVYLSHADFWKLPDAGARVLKMCRTAQQRELRISLELQRAINAHLDLVDDHMREDPELGRVFLSILGDVGRIRPILSDMHNAGILGAFLPEFGNLTCHMQFDSYHQYTVDEHTLIALGNLDAVSKGELPGLPRMKEILSRIRRLDLLALGLLLHDMGKYMGRGHVARGAIMVSPVAKRLGLDESEEELLYFLVERHVALSDASRMRDFREPSFLKSFAERIGNRTHLDMLYCLTYCDAKAVGEGILTGWQEALLSDIYDAVSEQLDSTAGQAPAGHHQRLRQELMSAGFPAERAEQYLHELPGNYSYQVPSGDVARHVKVLEEARAHGVGLIYEIKDKYVFLIASVPDRHGLFADVTATLTGNGFDILDARTWVTSAGQVLYNFRLTSVTATRLKEESLWKRLRQDLLGVGNGTVSGEQVMARRREVIGGNRPADSQFDDPAIKTEQRTSDHHTIVDIHIKDEPGLLSKLCRAISQHGCNIGYACINTMGDVAVDVFYVDRGGKKLTDEDADGLREHLVKSLGLRVSANV
jgi:[protein-PII] uridylyltransferase